MVMLEPSFLVSMRRVSKRTPSLCTIRVTPSGVRVVSTYFVTRPSGFLCTARVPFSIGVVSMLFVVSPLAFLYTARVTLSLGVVVVMVDLSRMVVSIEPSSCASSRLVSSPSVSLYTARVSFCLSG